MMFLSWPILVVLVQCIPHIIRGSISILSLHLWFAVEGQYYIENPVIQLLDPLPHFSGNRCRHDPWCAIESIFVHNQVPGLL